MKIAIIQSVVTGQWNYCPTQHRELLRLDLDDKPSAYTTPEAAEQAAKDDKTILCVTLQFIRFPKPTTGE